MPARFRPHSDAASAKPASLPEPLAALAVVAAPIALESRYRMLLSALVRLRRSRRGRWSLALGYGLVAVALALLTVRHFRTSGWPLTRGHPGLLVAAGLLLLLAQALKALGWGRLFGRDERPSPLALAAGNGGAALIGVILPGRFDDAMRVAVVRRYPGCPAGIRVLCLSLLMLGLIDSVALAPLALAAAVLPGVGWGMRAGLAIVAGAGAIAAVLILALPRLAVTNRFLRFRLGRWLGPRTTSRGLAAQAWALVSGLLARPRGRLLPALGRPRRRLLGSARAALPLRRGGSRGAADRSRRCGHTDRRRRRGADRIGHRFLPGARSRRRGRRARRPHRRRSPPRRDRLAHQPLAGGESRHAVTRGLGSGPRVDAETSCGQTHS